MIENKTYNYGKENGEKGLEATYMLRDDTLYIKIPGSDHWWDYLVNLRAWPRAALYVDLPSKLHPVWLRMARNLWKDIWPSHEDAKQIKRVDIIGHSMGGAVGAIAAIEASWVRPVKLTLINAPKFGNRAAVEALRTSGAEVHCLYDSGDIVHHLPLLYANYPERSLKCYGHTRGLGAAHNNKPKSWEEFPI